MDLVENRRIEATFCFVDIAGYTALTETRGDEAAADTVSLFMALVEGAAQDRGRVLEVIGDAALVMCPAPWDAVVFVTELFRTSQRVPHFPYLRAGLHAGTALVREGRLFGTALNLAARVATQAPSGHVLATQRVADVAAQHGIGASRLGSFHLKNLSEPVALFDLHVQEHVGGSHVDPVCRATVRHVDAACSLRFDGYEFWFCSQECADRFADDPARYLGAAPES